MCPSIFKFLPFLAIVPITGLLTVSFFVLVVLRKIEEKGLRAFGYVVTGLLWTAALVIFTVAIYQLARGPMMGGCTMPPRMMMNMQKMSPIVNTPGMVMPGKETLAKDGKSDSEVKCHGNKGFVSK